MAISKNYRSFLSFTILVDTCTIHSEYHEERVKSIVDYLSPVIGRINRMSNVFVGHYRRNDSITDPSDDVLLSDASFDDLR